MASRPTATELPSHLTPEQRAWIEEFLGRVRALLGHRLRDLRLFGSQLTGEIHDESDIDLLVLVDGCTYEDFQAVGRLASSISPWLDVRVTDFDEYHSPRSRATGFYKEMRKNSIHL